MKILSLSFLVFVVGLFSGVLGHQMITSGLLQAAIISIGLGIAVCLTISAFAITATGKEHRSWPPIAAGIVHLIVAISYLLQRRSGMPPDYIVTSEIAGVILAISGLILVCTPARKVRNRPVVPLPPGDRSSF